LPVWWCRRSGTAGFDLPNAFPQIRVPKVTTVTQKVLAGNQLIGYSDSTNSGILVVETQVKCGPVNPT
jgi:hypothetical protein